MNENTQKLSCVHGRLRRSCDQCAADAEIQELRAALTTAKQENARLREAAAPVVRWYYEDCISSTWPRPSDTRREFAALRDALLAQPEEKQ